MTIKRHQYKVRLLAGLTLLFCFTQNTAAATFAGTVYADRGGTPVADGSLIRLIVNGISAGTDITSAGNYTITATANAGDALLVYIDDHASVTGTSVTVANGGNLNNLDIYAQHLISRHDNGDRLNNLLMKSALGSYADSDILYTVDGANSLMVTGSATTLFIPSGQQFAPAAKVTTAHIDIEGRLDAANNDITVSGHWDALGGVFTSTASVTFNATTDSVNIRSGGNDFYDIRFNDNTGSTTFMLLDALGVINDLVLTDGILDSNSVDITVGNYFNQSGGQVQANASTIRVAGDFTADAIESSTGFNQASLVFTGNGSTLIYNNLANPELNGFYNLVVGQNGAIDTLTAYLTVLNQLSVGSGRFDSSTAMLYLNGQDDVLVLDGNANLSLVALGFAGSNQNIPTLLNGYDCNIYLTGANTTLRQTGHVTLNDGQSLHINGGGNRNNISRYNSADFDLNIGNHLSIGAGADNGAKTFNAGNSIISIKGNFVVQLAGGGTTQAQFNAANSTVIFNGRSDQHVLSSGTLFNKLTLNNNGLTGSDNVIFIDTVDINGALNILNGDFDISTNNPLLTTAGNVSIGPGGSIDARSRSSTWNFDGSSIFSDTSINGPQNLNDVILDGVDLTLASHALLRTMTISSGVLNLGNGGYVLEISGTGTPLTNADRFIAGISTVKYSGTGIATNITTLPYSSLQLSPNSATTYRLTNHLSNPNNMTGHLSIDNNARLEVTNNNYNLSAVDITIDGQYDAQNSTIRASGQWHNRGTFIPGQSNVQLTGLNQGIYGSTDFHHLSKTVTLADTLTFEAGTTQSIKGIVALSGNANQRLSLVSSTPGTHWFFNVQASANKNINTVSVAWSDASGSDSNQKPILPTLSVNAGNTIDWFNTPLIAIDKSSVVFSDPINNLSNPKRIPGAVIKYRLDTSNTGGASPDSNTLYITDIIDTAIVEFNVTTGIRFSDGSNRSSLSMNSASYSNDLGPTYNYVYTPVADAYGYDANITSIRIPMTGTFAYDETAPPSFSLEYDVRIK